MKSYEYSDILNQFKTNQNRSDYIIPSLVFNGYFQWRIPSRREWTRYLVWEGISISICTDGSKMHYGVVTGVYPKDFNISIYIRLPNPASIFQAVLLLGIKKPVKFY